MAGKLKTSANGQMLPLEHRRACPTTISSASGGRLFLAGDVRANENRSA